MDGHVVVRMPLHAPMSACSGGCSLIPGLGVKLSVIILAGPMVLFAVRANLPHDGRRLTLADQCVKRSCMDVLCKASRDLATAIVPAGTPFSR
jgi:hypothetical protein